ncbi:MAG: hypothetical protein QOJ65_2679 [Fimbriimonadaceae bacterium]|jgi:three-Cys-motif partner protein|nr:hypothetical protein [Fimbriimonadaceae bacterium]
MPTEPHSFGGEWTERKLELLDKYLAAYLQIFNRNPRASYFKTIYVDAFAGTGSIKPKLDPEWEAIYTIEDEYSGPLLDGSATIALRREPPFDRYVFIEKNPVFANELRTLADRMQPRRSVTIIPGDANQALIETTQSTDWKVNRAVAFLDPYGMQVEWRTIEAIAGTGAIDLWLLFPLSTVNRLLTTKAPPPPEWGLH